MQNCISSLLECFPQGREGPGGPSCSGAEGGAEGARGEEQRRLRYSAGRRRPSTTVEGGAARA
jgi:hypothetical protein